MCQLDHFCLTAPCCPPTTPPLAYLRSGDAGHPHAAVMVPLLEGMLLKRGWVPFADGSAVPVDLVDAAFAHRSETKLKELVRSATIDFRQYKTLQLLLALPVGFEASDESLAFLLNAARDRTNPDGDDFARGEDYSAGGWGCALS